MAAGKRIRAARDSVDRSKTYPLEDALKLFGAMDKTGAQKLP